MNEAEATIEVMAEIIVRLRREKLALEQRLVAAEQKKAAQEKSGAAKE